MFKTAETFKGMCDEYDFLKLFDGLLISGEEGIVKPNPTIFKLAIERFNLEPNKCIFVDDKFENVNAAKNLGFKIIHLIDPKNILYEIDKLNE